MMFCFFIAVLLVGVVSCSKDGEVRKYKEKDTPAPAASQDPHASMQASAAGAAATPVKPHFKWESPEGWEEAKSTSNFRLATFTIKSDKGEATCTIIPLQGEAGGLKANVSRWMAQVSGKAGHMDPKLAEGGEADVEKLLESRQKFLTNGQFPATMVDFTPLTPKDDDPSILASLITVGGSTVFVKLNGPKSVLVSNKEKFFNLSKSFDINTEVIDVEGHDHGSHQSADPKTEKSH